MNKDWVQMNKDIIVLALTLGFILGIAALFTGIIMYNFKPYSTCIDGQLYYHQSGDVYSKTVYSCVEVK